jgi:3D (Asp-Asp-Asp) domain-containing protein
MPALFREGILACALALAAVGCTSEASTSTGESDIVGTRIAQVQITNYTLARESDFASYDQFLCSGKGVAMQGTGIRNDGRFMKYVSGGGGWCGGYASLCNCASAKFAEVDSVFGSTGRALIKKYSIAVDPKRIPYGSYVWIADLGHWFRADDTGGAIIGNHIDVYTEGENPGFNFTSAVFVTHEHHEADDPGPSGEKSDPTPETPPPEPKIEERPTGGPFEALDVRAPVAAENFLTQCNESADGERVWTTRQGGANASSRWAEASYPQLPYGECGKPNEGKYPIVLRSEPEGALGGTWITQCAEDGGHVAHVFKVESTVDGHPAAPFQHDENDESCP